MKEKKGKATAKAYRDAISACHGAEKWSDTTTVFREMQEEGIGLDVKSYNAAIDAYGQEQEWESALGLLEDMRGNDFKPDAQSYYNAVSACREASKWGKALELLEEMPGKGLVKNAKTHDKEVKSIRKLAGTSTGTSNFKIFKPNPRPHRVPMRPLGPRLDNVKIRQGSPYAKEIRLLQHVFKHAKRGDPASVVRSIEYYGEGVLRGQWLKVAGGGKVPVLQAVVRAAPPGGFILEVGAYCGFSATQMAMTVPEAHISSLEVDPVHVIVARNVLDFGGLSSQVDVWTGHSKDLLSRISNRYGGPGNLLYSVAFFDQKGSRYDEDLTTLEKLGLLYPGAVCVADNVLKPGAPIFLWHVGLRGDYHAQVVSMKEFAMPAEDWMSVSVRKPHIEAKALEEQAKLAKEEAEKKKKENKKDNVWEPPPRYVRPDAPADLLQLNREADRIRDKATNGPGGRSVTYEEWDEFAQNANRRMAAEGIVVTAESVS